MLVKDFPEPAFTTVDLITSGSSIFKAGTPDLDPAVDLPRCQIAGAFDFESEVKVCVALLGEDELVAREIFLMGACGDGALLHPPHVRSGIPSGECFTIKERDRLLAGLSFFRLGQSTGKKQRREKKHSRITEPL